MSDLDDTVEKIRKSLMYLNEETSLYDFVKDSKIEIISNNEFFRTVFQFTFTAQPEIFRKTRNSHDEFIGTIKSILHKNFNYSDVLIVLDAEWDKLTYLHAEVKPAVTPWDEINEMKKTLMKQMQTAAITINFQNIGNTARNILQKMSDIVFDPKKHTPTNNKTNLGPAYYKNRLWAFVLYKFSETDITKEIRDHAENLLESSNRAIDLSNAITHSLNADAFLANSYVISTLTTVHIIKFAYEKKRSMTTSFVICI